MATVGTPLQAFVKDNFSTFGSRGHLPLPLPNKNILVGVQLCAKDVREAAKLLGLHMPKASVQGTVRGHNIKYISEGTVSLAFSNNLAILRLKEKTDEHSIYNANTHI